MTEKHETPRLAPPVVLLHGVGLDRTVWDALRALMPEQTDALDLPGHGARPPLRAPASLAELADDVRARMPRGPVHLVGFSLGALIAQHIAAFHPEVVASLTCVSSVCKRTPDEAAAVAGRLEAARADFPASVATSLERWFPHDTEVPPATIVATERVLLANDRASYLHAYEVFATGDAVIAPELHRITAPTLAITGELDPGSTPEMTARLAAAVPGARALVVPGARHMLPVEDAPALAAALTAFIDETQKAEATA
ncbi:alpha/beta fold hydrolase [Agrococcus sp. HG114]|uniref:alpha/beta fold hydrolase n=1 Tax=Agrococcus sp. HG114 TaxID=2969757 RepID=UPI00215A641C|nr:alpha/beta hydrolase [Agrococcus sp. HG114]MCR8669548.1 alpha/beta hydrolase [Agrococcus sp. HG114]